MAGSWYGLLAIAREQQDTTRTYVSMRPTHCPLCGTLLTPHPRSAAILRCTFDGYEPTGMDHP